LVVKVTTCQYHELVEAVGPIKIDSALTILIIVYVVIKTVYALSCFGCVRHC